MMGAVTLETCRVTLQWNKSDCVLLHLVGLLFNVNYDPRNYEFKISNTSSEACGSTIFFFRCRRRTIRFQRNVRNVDVLCIWGVHCDGRWCCVTGYWVFHVTETVIVVPFSRARMSRRRDLLVVSKVRCEIAGDPTSHPVGTRITHPQRCKNLKTNWNFVYKF